MIKGWEQQQTEVVEENPSYYNCSDDIDVQNHHQGRKKAIKHTEKKSKGACNTCFTRPKDKIEDLQTNRTNVRYDRELYLQGKDY